MESEVVLYGARASSYCKRVELALKLKGITFVYVEEDLKNKSQQLLHYNPVHGKVPVLVHKGKAIAESLVILEYIDECWDSNPKLLPDDPYLRAKIRFWANFFDQKLIPSVFPIIKSKGKDQEKAIEDFQELVRVFEEGIEKDDFPTRSPFFNGEQLGFLDIIVGTVLCNYRAFHEVVAVILNQEKNPIVFEWVNALESHLTFKEILTPYEKLVEMMKERFGTS